MMKTGIASNDGHGNGGGLNAAAEHLLSEIILMPCGTVDMGIDVYVDSAVPDRITCNRANKRVPGGIVNTGGLASEGVRVIWSHR